VLIMKRLLFAVLVLCAVCVPPVCAEQTRCNAFDTYDAGGPGNNDKRMDACRDYCRQRSGNLDRYLSSGWSVESQRPITIMQRPFKVNEVGVPEQGYCRCIGAEYILKR
jgi:hypothetical protein